MGGWRGLKRREAPLDLYNLAIGVFLIVAPWLFAFTHETARMDSRLVGVALVVVSVAALLAFSAWEELVILVLGLWLLAAPWLLGFAHTSGMHVSIAAGVLVTYFAALELWLIYDAGSEGGSSSLSGST